MLNEPAMKEQLEYTPTPADVEAATAKNTPLTSGTSMILKSIADGTVT